MNHAKDNYQYHSQFNKTVIIVE